MEAELQSGSGCATDGGSSSFVQRPWQEVAGGEEPLRGGILLVDDEDYVRDVVQDMLEDAGYRVFSVENGQEAISFFRDNYNLIDLLVSDVVMPIMNGSEMYEHLNRLRPGLPVVFMSGYLSDVLTPLLGAKHVEFIGKPMKQEALVKAVQNVLHHSG
jgi:two-component system, cell cycle sensor histidine kinase and response regulator CckA